MLHGFDWDWKNEMHIARHRLVPNEVEEAFVDGFCYRKTNQGKYLGFGRTANGRYLFVVFVRKGKSRIRVITARDMDGKERRQYRKWQGGANR